MKSGTMVSKKTQRRSIEQIALDALERGRLFFRVSDQNGFSCNGGNRHFRPDPCTNRRPGKWAPKLRDVRLCSVGYHCTTDPLLWIGSRVCLVEVLDVVDSEDNKNKIVCSSFRELAVVDPTRCVDIRVYVACKRPYLRGEDLSFANLRGAHLVGADMSSSNLMYSDLDDALLVRTNFTFANLMYANLSGSNLTFAVMNCARVVGADMTGSDTTGASML